MTRGKGGGVQIVAPIPLPISQEGQDIAEGNREGHTNLQKFGRNTDIDIAASEDIWDGGGTWVAPTVARVHNIASTSANDDGDPAGSGAQTVEIFGLDASFLLQSETIILNGLTDVPTVNSYTMIHRMIVRSAGATGANAGDITATAVTDATVTAQISAGFNQTLMAIYQIPAGKTGYIQRFYASIHAGSPTGKSDVELRVQPDGEVFQIKNIQGISTAGSSHFDHPFPLPLAISALTTIKLIAAVTANSMDISAGFDLILVDD